MVGSGWLRQKPFCQDGIAPGHLEFLEAANDQCEVRPGSADSSIQSIHTHRYMYIYIHTHEIYIYIYV